MTQFVLVRNFFEGERLQTTTVLGLFASPTDAQSYADGLIKEMRDNMEWKDEAPAWVYDETVTQWSTTDFPPDDLHNRYIIQPL